MNIQANAIILNVGNHDTVPSSDPGVPFKDAYKTLLSTIRSKNPSAWIFPILSTDLAVGAARTALQGHIGTAITELGDVKMLFVDVGQYDCSSTGCNYLSNVADEKRIADILVPVIKQKLGW